MNNISRGRCLLGDLISSRGWTYEHYATISGRSARMISYFCNNERTMLPEDIYVAMLIFNCEITNIYEFIEQDAE